MKETNRMNVIPKVIVNDLGKKAIQEFTITGLDEQIDNIIRSLAYNSDGKIFVAVISQEFISDNNFSNILKVYECTEGKWLNIEVTLTNSYIEELVDQFIFKDNGRTIVIKQEDKKQIEFWDVESGICSSTFSIMDGDDQPGPIAISPKGDLIAYETHEDIKVWNVEENICIHSFPVPHDEEDQEFFLSSSIEFSPDQKYIATNYGRCKITLCDLVTKEVKPLYITENSLRFKFSPDGTMIVSVNDYSKFSFWDIATRNMLHSTHLNSNVWSLCFNPEGNLLITNNEASKIHVWEVLNDSLQRTFEVCREEQEEEIIDATFNRRLGIIALCIGASLENIEEKTYFLKIWNITTHTFNTLYEAKRSLYSPSISHDGSSIAVCADDHDTLIIWDITENKKEPIEKKAEFGIKTISFSQDDRILATGGTNGILGIWDVKTGDLVKSIKVDDTENVEIVKFSPDNKLLAAGTVKGTVIFYDVKTFRNLFTLNTLDASWIENFYDLYDITFDHTGKIVASLTNRYIDFWDVTNGKKLFRIPEPSGFKVEIASDGKFITYDLGEISIWDIKYRQKLWYTTGHDYRLAIPTKNNLIIVTKYQIEYWLNYNDLILTTVLTTGTVLELEKLTSVLNGESISKAFSPEDFGTIAFLPYLKLPVAENDYDEYQFLLNTKKFKNKLAIEGRENLSHYLNTIGISKTLFYYEWTFTMYQLPEGESNLEKRVKIRPESENIRQFDLYIPDRNNQVLYFQIVLDIPSELGILVKNIQITLESDRGESIPLVFNNFYYKKAPEIKESKKFPKNHFIRNLYEYQKIVPFKIDSSYNMRSIAWLEVTDIKVEYENYFSESPSEIEIIKKKLEEMENMLRSVLNEKNGDSTESNLDNEAKKPKEYSNLNDELLEAVNRFKNDCQKPQLPRMGIKIGSGTLRNNIISYSGKYAEFIMAAVILAGSLPGPIQFMLRVILDIPVNENLPMIVQLLSYTPIIFVLLLMTFLFYKNQRKLSS